MIVRMMAITASLHASSRPLVMPSPLVPSLFPGATSARQKRSCEVARAAYSTCRARGESPRRAADHVIVASTEPDDAQLARARDLGVHPIEVDGRRATSQIPGPC